MVTQAEYRNLYCRTSLLADDVRNYIRHRLGSTIFINIHLTSRSKAPTVHVVRSIDLFNVVGVPTVHKTEMLPKHTAEIRLYRVYIHRRTFPLSHNHTHTSAYRQQIVQQYVGPSYVWNYSRVTAVYRGCTSLCALRYVVLLLLLNV